MHKIKVLIADDHPIFRIGLANVIKASGSLSLIFEADNGQLALDQIAELQPDIAVLDIEMPNLNGLQVCEAVCKITDNKTKIIILTLYKETDLYQKAMEVGASGYLLKDNAVDQLELAIQTVFDGNTFISDGLNAKLVNKNSRMIIDQKFKTALGKLSQTEKNILILISEHKTTKEIAKKLFVSEKTIENHRYNIAKKLELSPGQNSLLVFALEHSEGLK